MAVPSPETDLHEYRYTPVILWDSTIEHDEYYTTSIQLRHITGRSKPWVIYGAPIEADGTLVEVGREGNSRGVVLHEKKLFSIEPGGVTPDLYAVILHSSLLNRKTFINGAAMEQYVREQELDFDVVIAALLSVNLIVRRDVVEDSCIPSDIFPIIVPPDDEGVAYGPPGGDKAYGGPDVTQGYGPPQP